MAGNVLRPPSTIPPPRTGSPGATSARAALPRRARRSTRTGSPPQRRSRPSPASSTRAAASRRGRRESRDRRSERRAGHRARSSSPSGAARTAPAPWRPAGRAGTSASGVSAGPTRKIAASASSSRMKSNGRSVSGGRTALPNRWSATTQKVSPQGRARSARASLRRRASGSRARFPRPRAAAQR